MRHGIGVVVGVCGFLLLSGATVWGASCEGMPANSISRYECERTAKQESLPKPKPRESVTIGGVAERAMAVGIEWATLNDEPVRARP